MFEIDSEKRLGRVLFAFVLHVSGCYGRGPRRRSDSFVFAVWSNQHTKTTHDDSETNRSTTQRGESTTLIADFYVFHFLYRDKHRECIQVVGRQIFIPSARVLKKFHSFSPSMQLR